MLNSVHVEELLELDATKLLHDDDREEADLHAIAWISFVEFSASIRVCVNVITKEQQQKAQQDKKLKRNDYISTEKMGQQSQDQVCFCISFICKYIIKLDNFTMKQSLLTNLEVILLRFVSITKDAEQEEATKCDS